MSEEGNQGACAEGRERAPSGDQARRRKKPAFSSWNMGTLTGRPSSPAQPSKPWFSATCTQSWPQHWGALQ
jgi:hypothetical protein